MSLTGSFPNMTMKDDGLMGMKRLLALLALVLALSVVFSGCFPFGVQQRKIAGDFSLEQWEDSTTYYLRKRGADNSGGGVIEGTVDRIGWSERYIVVKRRSLFRGDPDGWMIIDLKSKVIVGPFSDADFSVRSQSKNIETFAPGEAWKKLSR